jgi:hypothetical protein
MHAPIRAAAQDDNWSSKLMGDGADGTSDLNGSDVSDCGLSPLDMKDMKTSWVANMDAVKAAILENKGFIWQQMVNNGTGTSSVVHKGPGCATTLRAACKLDSIERRGALNYGIRRAPSPTPGSGAGGGCCERACCISGGCNSDCCCSGCASGGVVDLDEHLASFLLMVRGPRAPRSGCCVQSKLH